MLEFNAKDFLNRYAECEVTAITQKDGVTIVKTSLLQYVDGVKSGKFVAMDGCAPSVTVHHNNDISVSYKMLLELIEILRA